MSEKELYTDMVSFADLNEAVKKLGYESKAYKIDKQILKTCQCPYACEDRR